MGQRYLGFGVDSPLASSMKTYSLCAESYDNVLGGLGNQLKLIVDQRLALPVLDDAESISLVVLVRGGQRLELKPEVDYVIETVADGRVIRFATQRLVATDIVEITIDRKN